MAPFTSLSRLAALLAVLLSGLALEAQEVSFTARAPKVVSTGERFRLVYSVNAQGTDLEAGPFEGFGVLSGPSQSTSTSVQIFNGQMQQKVELSYTYILEASKEGKFTIPPARITVADQEYTSKAVTIEVVKGQRAGPANSGSAAPGGKPTPGNSDAAGAVGPDDLFLRMVVSQREALRGEPVVATLKLYTRVQLADLGGFKTPAFNGFWSETLRQAQQLNFQREQVNGQVYNAAVLQQHVLIPERSGTLEIEPAELTAIARIPVRSRARSLFDDFFGRYRSVEKTLVSAPVDIQVKPLPAGAPAAFRGAVGDIRMEASLSTAEAQTNEAISLKITYSGTGNLKLLPEPEPDFPTDFEVYDPKVSNNFSAGARGFSGSKTYEYLLIPRHAGDFEIAVPPFAVFDPDARTYKAFTAGPFPVHVEPGEGGEVVTGIDPGRMKEEVNAIGSDIRYIRTGDFPLRDKDRPFFGSPSFYLAYALAFGLFLLILFIGRQRRKRREDVTYMKNKKAGRVAQSRLKTAKKHLDQQDRGPFYQEILNALWGYLSDKLNLPQAELNKEKVGRELEARQVAAPLADAFIGLIDRCEFAQFAPGDSEERLSGVYQEAAELIGKLEKAFARSGAGRAGKNVIP